MPWIVYPPEPKELLLAWQDTVSADRLRWLIGRLTYADNKPVFEYLNDEEFKLQNGGQKTWDDAMRSGFAGYPAFAFNRCAQNVFQDNVLEAFLRRIPSRSRADFSAYLKHFFLLPETALSDFALLGITEARLPSDGFSLINPLDVQASCLDFTFEIAGFRHYRKTDHHIQIDDPVQLTPEPDNERDSNAVLVIWNDCKIGYVNRLQAPTIKTWLKTRKLTCHIARTNGTADKPRVYAFLQVRPDVWLT